MLRRAGNQFHSSRLITAKATSCQQKKIFPIPSEKGRFLIVKTCFEVAQIKAQTLKVFFRKVIGYKVLETVKSNLFPPRDPARVLNRLGSKTV